MEARGGSHRRRRETEAARFWRMVSAAGNRRQRGSGLHAAATLRHRGGDDKRRWVSGLALRSSWWRRLVWRRNGRAGDGTLLWRSSQPAAVGEDSRGMRGVRGSAFFRVYWRCGRLSAEAQDVQRRRTGRVRLGSGGGGPSCALPGPEQVGPMGSA